MKWKRIPKEKSKQPKKGIYSDWKEIIRRECFYQCVYCAIHESRFGGTRNFHIDHYKPKSLFSRLENNIKNLFYSCSICNTFKGDDWPNNPCKKFSNISYPNPSYIDYTELFFTHEEGEVEGKFLASKYMVEKLYLNRPQLIIERRKSCIDSKITEWESFIKRNRSKLAPKILYKMINMLLTIEVMYRELNKLVPYDTKDIKR